MLRKTNNRIAFYVDYAGFNSKEAPPILFFISFLRNIGYKVDFFVTEKDLLNALKNPVNKYTSGSADGKKISNAFTFNGADPNYDICLLSLMSADNLRKILQTAIKIKEYSPFTVNVLGGTGVYGYCKDLIRAEGIDITIEGDAEKTLPAVLDNIATVLSRRYCSGRDCGNGDGNDTGDNIYNNHSNRSDSDSDAVIFENYPEKLVSGITQQEAYYCTSEHMELLFKRKRRCLSPIINLPDNIFFERKVLGFTIKCPVSNVAIKLNNGEIRFFEKINITHKDFNSFYEHYKDIMTAEEFAGIILPFPNEEEINAGYIDYPWDIYDNYEFESVGIYAQRGCNWGKCSYCSIVNYKYRKLNASLLLKVINEAKSHNVYGFSFDDDLFVQNKIWLNEFLDKIIAGKFNERFSFTAMFKVEHINDEELLNKIKQANFTKIQIGIESFLPKKISYFSKTKEGKEQTYINKAKKVIDYCAGIKIIPSSFIILTAPEKNFSLFDIVREMGEIIDVIIDVYGRRGVLPIFMFNDFINAYPNAPLLNRQSYSRFIVPLCGEINRSENNGIYTDTLNLRTLEVPYLYKFENLKIAHFINLLLKNKNKNKNENENENENRKTGKDKKAGEQMFLHINNILNSLNAAFDLYGTPAFLLYDIIDRLNLAYDGNDDILKKIIADYFDVNDVDKFKNYIASGKIDQNKALEIFSAVITGFDELKIRHKEKKIKGKAITGVLAERIDTFKKQYKNMF